MRVSRELAHYARHDTGYCALTPVLCIQVGYYYPFHSHKYSLLVPSSLRFYCRRSGETIALLMKEAVVKASLEGLSENSPDAVTAMSDLIPPCRGQGRWREAEEHQIENTGACDSANVIVKLIFCPVLEGHPGSEMVRTSLDGR
jgi:hypothetical protein